MAWLGVESGDLKERRRRRAAPIWLGACRGGSLCCSPSPCLLRKRQDEAKMPTLVFPTMLDMSFLSLTLGGMAPERSVEAASQGNTSTMGIWLPKGRGQWGKGFD